MLNLEGLGKEFEGRWLFRGLDLQVLRGERIGIVGPNGAGKTTLFRLIVGEETPTEGRARLGHHIGPGYHRQDRLELNPSLTALDEVWRRAPQSRAGELRSLRNFCTQPYYDAAAFGIIPPTLKLWSSTAWKDGQDELAYVVRLDEALTESRAVDDDGPALCVR